jgi:DnaJ-class molecular chaperone
MVTKAKRKLQKKTAAPQPVVAEAAPEYQPCPDCDGKGFKEFNAGLLSVKCQHCEGTGKATGK